MIKQVECIPWGEAVVVVRIHGPSMFDTTVLPPRRLEAEHCDPTEDPEPEETEP